MDIKSALAIGQKKTIKRQNEKGKTVFNDSPSLMLSQKSQLISLSLSVEDNSSEHSIAHNAFVEKVNQQKLSSAITLAKIII